MKILLAAFIVGLLGVGPTAAQTSAKNADTLARIYKVIVQNSGQGGFEVARLPNVRHQRREAWAWHSWQVLTGKFTGAVVSGSFAHSWTDLDATRLHTELADSLTSYLSNSEVLLNSYFQTRADLSTSTRRIEEGTVLPYLEAQYYEPHIGQEAAFEAILQRTKVAYAQVREPPLGYLVYRLANGGSSLYLLLTPYEFASELQKSGRDLPALWDEALGTQESYALREGLRAAVRVTYSENWRYRRDLSYVPGG